MTTTVPRTIRLPLGTTPRRLIFITAMASTYSVAFVSLHPAIGSVAGSLSVLPVIAVGWWFGLRAGLAAGIAAIALNAALHAVVGEPWWTVVSARGATGSAVVVVVAVLVGHVQGTRVALARELAARVAAEAAATASASRARAILDAASEGVIVTDEQGRIVEVNRSAERLFERSRDELLTLLLDQILRPSMDGRAKAQPSDPGGVGIKADGSEFPAEMSSAPIAGDGSAALVMTVRDVGQRLRDEQSLRQTQRMEAIGQLAGGIAHDFNNLLTAIIGYSGLLLAADVTEADRRFGATEIQKAADRAAALTRRLLEFSRRQAVNREAINLSDVVTGLEPMLRRLLGEHILIVLDLDGDLDAVCADRAQMEQVVLNLAINARDAMGEGGVLTISTRSVAADYSDERALNRTVRLTVADTGTGMDPSVLERIFDPFFTTKGPGQGTGLGLSSVHGIVQSFDGEIRVATELGQGSTFEVALPTTKAPLGLGRGVVETVEELTGGHETVLLVEDEPAVRELGARYLRSHGYEVLVAGSMKEALGVVSSALGSIDLVVTDVVMPGGSGPQLLRALRAGRADLPVLFLSGYPDGEFGKGGAPLDGPLLPKPFKSDQLIRAVRDVLGSGPERRNRPK